MPGEPDQDALKHAVAAAAAERVRDGMVVGLGSGSTAELVVRRLAERVGEGLRFVAIPSSERTAALARAGSIRLSDFAAHPHIDLTIDGADQVERDTLNLIKGRGGALLREKIVADASDRLLIVVDASKLADRLDIAVPVEVVPFGLDATARKIERLGARVARRMGQGGAAYVTDSGNAILDCDFGPIADPAALEAALRALVGVVETGLFVGRAQEVLVADGAGVHSLGRGRMAVDAGMAQPVVVAIMGVSGSGKTTVARALAEHLGWPYREGDALHPPENIEKMSHGIPLTDEDRWPWLKLVANWIDEQLAAGRSGIVTCSLLRRPYRDLVIGGRRGVVLLYLRGDKAVIAERMAHRKGHFMPPSLLDSQFATLEEPGPDEHPLIADVNGPIEATVASARALLDHALGSPATD